MGRECHPVRHQVGWKQAPHQTRKDNWRERIVVNSLSRLPALRKMNPATVNSLSLYWRDSTNIVEGKPSEWA